MRIVLRLSFLLLAVPLFADLTTTKLRAPQALIFRGGSPEFAIGYQGRQFLPLVLERLDTGAQLVLPCPWRNPLAGDVHTEHVVDDVFHDPIGDVLWILTRKISFHPHPSRGRDYPIYGELIEFRVDLKIWRQEITLHDISIRQSPIYETLRPSRRTSHVRPPIIVLSSSHMDSGINFSRFESEHSRFAEAEPLLKTDVLHDQIAFEGANGPPLLVTPKADRPLVLFAAGRSQYARLPNHAEEPPHLLSHRVVVTDSGTLVEEVSLEDGGTTHHASRRYRGLLEDRDGALLDADTVGDDHSSIFSHVDPIQEGVYFFHRPSQQVFYRGVGYSDPFENEEFLIAGSIPHRWHRHRLLWYRPEALGSVRPECVESLISKNR